MGFCIKAVMMCCSFLGNDFTRAAFIIFKGVPLYFWGCGIAFELGAKCFRIFPVQRNNPQTPVNAQL